MATWDHLAIYEALEGHILRYRPRQLLAQTILASRVHRNRRPVPSRVGPRERYLPRIWGGHVNHYFVGIKINLICFSIRYCKVFLDYVFPCRLEFWARSEAIIGKRWDRRLMSTVWAVWLFRSNGVRKTMPFEGTGKMRERGGRHAYHRDVFAHCAAAVMLL